MVGVTVIVPEIGAPVVLVAVNAGVFPFPEAPSPMPVLELVHPNVAPVGVLLYTDAGTVDPAQ